MQTENLSTLKIHQLTGEQYRLAKENGRVQPNEIYLVKDEPMPVFSVNGITPDENGDVSIPYDTTLAISGMGADAQAVGEALTASASALQQEINDVKTELEQSISTKASTQALNDTKTELEQGINGKAPAIHEHAASAITSGVIPLTRGGTNATTGDAGLANLLAAGPTILSSNQYGTTLPASAATGQLFLQKYDGSVDELSNTLIMGLMQKMYPVGSVYTTKTNTNPSTLLGFGTWNLIGKNFITLTTTSSEIFTMASGVTNSNTGTAMLRTGQTIRLRLGFNINQALTDTALVLGSLNLSFLGLSSSGISYTISQGIGASDGGNAIVIGQLNYGGELSVLDVVGADTIAASTTFYFDLTLPAQFNNMLDSACDQFHWERTA